MYFDVDCMVDKRKHKRIFSEISRRNNGTRRRKAARNRKPCTFASLLLKVVRSTCKYVKFKCHWLSLLFISGESTNTFSFLIFIHLFSYKLEQSTVVFYSNKKIIIFFPQFTWQSTVSTHWQLQACKYRLHSYAILYIHVLANLYKHTQ